MKKPALLVIAIVCVTSMYSQKVLISWGQQNIEGLTKDKYDLAQNLGPKELLEKNKTDSTWCDVFLTLNSSINHQVSSAQYLNGLADQLNTKETKLTGTSRLIIWDRIVSNDLVFEGKGLVIDNDLFRVCGRANQVLQNLTKKNFGFVSMTTNEHELAVLKSKWLEFLSNKPVKEFAEPELKNAKISEISSLKAFEALVISLKDNEQKQQLTKNCRLSNKFYLLSSMTGASFFLVKFRNYRKSGTNH
jgi:hypothetical protein